MKLPALLDPRASMLNAARVVSRVALQGIPAVRAALHAAKAGAGAAFGPAVVERLGMRVIPGTARTIGLQLAHGASDALLVLKRGDAVMRAGAKELMLHTHDGLTLSVSSAGKAAATVTHDAVRAVARQTARGTLLGVGRAAMGGAFAGAAIDGTVAGVTALRDLNAGVINRDAAVKRVGRSAARGAFSGAFGVAAAGAVSYGLAATGLVIVGAPVAIPLATMVAASALATRMFDRAFTAPETTALPEST